MAIVLGTDESGTQTFFDVPAEELSKHKLESKILTDEDQAKLFPGKEELTKDDLHGQIPVGSLGQDGGDVEGYSWYCWQYFTAGGILWRRLGVCA
jgi:hypothetical protein